MVTFPRASSYEPGNQAGPVSGTNFVFCSYGKVQPGYRDEECAKGGLFSPKTAGTISASMGHFDFYSSKQSNNWLAISLRNLHNGHCLSTLSKATFHLVSDLAEHS